MNTELLRQHPLFTGLSDRDLDEFYRRAEIVDFQPGELIIEEGATGDTLFIVLEGEVEIYRNSAQGNILLAVRGAGEVIGEMAVISGAPRNASVRALAPSRLLTINRSAFEQVLVSCPSAAMAMLNTVTARLRSTEMLLVQHQKLAALGTLSAGLAHELNNPAAALRRSTSHLQESLVRWQVLTADVCGLNLEPEQVTQVRDLLQILAKPISTEPLDPLTRSDWESAVQDWLEDHGVAEPWELAPVLVAAGWDSSRIAELADTFESPHLPIVIQWLAAGLTVNQLLREIGISATDISEIVRAVKDYSYLDQAPVQEIDVHAGLENTLVILRHKLDHVRIKRDYASNLPRVEAYAGELNQVWTNLIDNAIDAMDGHGEIGIKTYQEGEQVVVEISDTGPGIPESVLPRLFEPFFTTKAPGSGTGLGLHIVYKSIVEKHRGNVQVSSKPGQTCFQISLPTRLPRPTAA